MVVDNTMLINAATIIARLANVPSSSPNSNALDVPVPWAPHTKH